MTQLDQTQAFNLLKKLPFSKSWQNVFVSKTKKIVNPKTGALEDKELEDFIYIPAINLVRHFSNDKDFMRFRVENKNSKEWNFKLVADPLENNNRRLSVVYLENILNSLGINFIVDDSYTPYILNDEVQKLTALEISGIREFVNSLRNQKVISTKKGSSDTWN